MPDIKNPNNGNIQAEKADPPNPSTTQPTKQMSRARTQGRRRNTTTRDAAQFGSPDIDPTTPSGSARSRPPRATITDDISGVFEDFRISPDYNPRSFPHSVKQQCWDKAEKIKGRDPDRWRRDSLGNIVFRKLVGCPGCLCHDYDHILPYSKGGKSTLENCQVLQATVNRSKGNRVDISKSDLIQKSSYCRVSGRDMDLLELSAYGNVRRGQDSVGCTIQ